MRNSVVVVLAAAVYLGLVGCQGPGFSDRTIKQFQLNDFTAELSDYELLGIDLDKHISDEQIRDALDHPRIAPTLQKGQRLMIVQSGQPLPDTKMMDLLEPIFHIQTFSGVTQYKRQTPESEWVSLTKFIVAAAAVSSADQSQSKSHKSCEHEQQPKPTHAQVMRLAAAQSGINTIMVYWRYLESGVINHQTKLISWIPIAGMIIPDETKYMRLRIKVCLIDVKTGQWEAFHPKVVNGQILTGAFNRDPANQKQLNNLIDQAYTKTVEALLAEYIR